MYQVVLSAERAVDWDLWIRGFVDGERGGLGFLDSWICGWGRRGRLFVRGGLGGARRVLAAGRGTGLGGGERTACVGGAAVVALIADSGRGQEPGGRGEGADFAVAGVRR